MEIFFANSVGALLTSLSTSASFGCQLLLIHAKTSSELVTAFVTAPSNQREADQCIGILIITQANSKPPR